MAEGKKSFVLYSSWKSEVEKLSNKDVGILFFSILKFVNDEVTDLNDNIRDLYYAITEQIVYEWNKYNPKSKKYHWNYKGGISNENHIIRNSTEMKVWRSKVFIRDNFTCQKCNVKGGVLNAHHIKPFAHYPELRFELSNGLTLCKCCHIEEHKKIKNG